MQPRQHQSTEARINQRVQSQRNSTVSTSRAMCTTIALHHLSSNFSSLALGGLGGRCRVSC
eukprot:15148082-Heterocapsa_arctica.AAC.1